jgi:site-specific DNA recombinase
MASPRKSPSHARTGAAAPAVDPVVCGIYVRISHDRREVDEAGSTNLTRLGVKRQRKDCAAEAERRGWVVHDVYEDNDISAFSGKRRPAYERLLADVEAGRIGGVIVWDVDRLHRTPLELEFFVPLIEATGAVVVSVSGGDYDLETADGRFKARIMGAVARKESEDKSRRQRRKALEIAQSGRPKGGGMRGYGYAADHVTVIEAEAEAIREAMARVLGGSSVRSIVHDFQARGLPTTTGKPWAAQTLTRILQSARIAGWREHQGEFLAEAQWPAIVSREDVERVRAIFADPARRRTTRKRKYLLTGGLARCGVCGVPLIAGAGNYRCTTEPRQGGCGAITVVAERFEKHLIGEVTDLLDDAGLTRRLAAAKTSFVDERKLVEAINADEEQLTDLADMWADGKMTKAGYLKAHDRISSRLDAARRKLADVAAPSPAIVVAQHGGVKRLRQRWPDMTVTERREVLVGLVDAVHVDRAQRRGNFFDEDRVRIDWRT